MNCSPELVHVRRLAKSYGGRQVVRDLDLTVRAGQIVGLIGANGAGKTTTVEILQGLRAADSGVVRVLGFDPATDAARLRPLLGSQLQDSGLPDRLRVSEAVDLFRTGPREEAHHLIDAFGLGQRRRSAFASLSGGERQRLFLVLALLNRPELVILDELTQNLDPSARRNVWSAIRQLRASGTTVLLVTHELEEAEVLCDHVVAMAEGRVLDEGTPAELVARHGRTTTMRFSAPPDARFGGLPGVERVTDDHGVRTVTGDRMMVAHVSAALLRRGEVPSDLWVEMPRLEDALVSMLEVSV